MPQSEKETSSIPTTLNNDTARHKMIFLSMLSGALAYRDKYIGKELEENRALTDEMAASAVADKKKISTPAKAKKVQQKANHMHYEFKKRVERFNALCAKEIDSAWQEFKKPNNNAFQDYIDNFGAVLEETINSKNISELVSVCQAYNAGLLGDVLAVINEKRADAVEDANEKLDNIINGNFKI